MVSTVHHCSFFLIPLRSSYLFFLLFACSLFTWGVRAHRIGVRPLWCLFLFLLPLCMGGCLDGERSSGSLSASFSSLSSPFYCSLAALPFSWSERAPLSAESLLRVPVLFHVFLCGHPGVPFQHNFYDLRLLVVQGWHNVAFCV